MSERNIEVIRQVYAGFLAKDLEAVLRLQSEEAEWSVAGPAELIPWAGPHHGPTGVATFLKTLGQRLAAEQFEIREYLAAGETVVTLGYQSGKVAPTGQAYEFDFVHVWRLENGKIVSFRVYYDTCYVAGVLREAAWEMP